MLFSELRDTVLLNSGQYITGLDSFDLDNNTLFQIAKTESGKMSKWVPPERTGVFHLYQGKIFSVDQDGVIPKIITEIRRQPSEGQSTSLTSMFANGATWTNWDYRRPALVYFGMPAGMYQVRYADDYKIEEIPGEEDWEFEASGSEFIDLVTGRFMMIIARMGRTFEVGEFPFSMNASMIYSEGEEIYKSASDRLKETSNWHLAILT